MHVQQRYRQIPSTLARTGAMTALAALVGSAASGRPSKTIWFTNLRKPGFQPPPVVFPVVWTVLYLDIAVSSAIAWNGLRENDDEGAARAYLRALAANLAINAGWSWVFFRSHRLAAAPAVAAVLAFSSADLAQRSGSVNRSAGLALVPYAGWCGFATVLSAAIWRINRR
jgi:benzodiazapine receptor